MSCLRSGPIEHAQRHVNGKYPAGRDTPQSREGRGARARRHIDDQRTRVGPPDACDKLISHGDVMLVKVVTVGGSVENRGGKGHRRHVTRAPQVGTR